MALHRLTKKLYELIMTMYLTAILLLCQTARGIRHPGQQTQEPFMQTLSNIPFAATRQP